MQYEQICICLTFFHYHCLTAINFTWSCCNCQSFLISLFHTANLILFHFFCTGWEYTDMFLSDHSAEIVASVLNNFPFSWIKFFWFDSSLIMPLLSPSNFQHPTFGTDIVFHLKVLLDRKKLFNDNFQFTGHRRCPRKTMLLTKAEIPCP